MTLWPKLILLLGVEIAALAAMVADKQWTLATGTPVLLETVPVDPRSLFMGDYVRLSYAISQLPIAALAGDKDFKRHDPIWVALQPNPAGAKAVSVHHQRDAIAPGLIALKGEVEEGNDIFSGRANNGPIRQHTLSVRYGIEQYFVQEGSGAQIERPSGGEKVTIRVAIDTRGKAGILAVLLDGRERHRETLF